MKQLADKVNVDQKIAEYIVSILTVTRPENSHKAQSGKQIVNTANTADITRYIQFGASPRAGIAMIQCAKIHAMFEARDYVLPEDVKAVAKNILRHRLVLSYEAIADSITSDKIIDRILTFVPIP